MRSRILAAAKSSTCGLFAWAATALLGLAAGPVTNLTWRWSNPSPFGNAVADLAWATNRPYLAACDRGQIYLSDDAATWRRADTGVTRALRDATYLGGRAVVVGETGLVLWSDTEAFAAVETGVTNWLESVAASSTRLVAVGDAGIVMTSTDGLAWTRGQTGRTNWLRSVAAGFGIFVAVGETGFVATSVDGVSWTVRASGRTTADLNRVIVTPSGFMAVGARGTVLTSRDGAATQWDASRIVTENPLVCAVAVGQERVVGGDAELRFGVGFGGAFVWSSETNPLRNSPAPITDYTSLLYDGSRIVAATKYGLIVTGTRSTTFAGYSWTFSEPAAFSTIWDSTTTVSSGTNVTASYTNGAVLLSTNSSRVEFRVLAGERALFMDSPDGAAWDRGLAPAAATNTDYFGIGGRSGLLVAAGSGGAIARSRERFEMLVTTNLFTNGAVVIPVVLTNHVNTLGIAWESVATPTTQDLQGVCSGASLFVVTGGNGTILTSPDTSTWTTRSSGVTSFLSSAAAWPGGFVATGQGGALLTSPDGVAWTRRDVGRTNWLWRVRWLVGRLWVVGQSGLVLTSADGAVWTRQDTGSTTWWNDIALIDGGYFLAGDDGMVAAGDGAGTWTVSRTTTSRNLYTASAQSGQLVVAGAAAGILRARVSPFDGPVRFLDYPKAPDQGLFLLAGQLDQRFRLARSTDAGDWPVGDLLEIADPGGVLILLDYATNDPVRQFFRTTGP